METLNNWLDDMLERINSEQNIKLKDYFEYTQVIYSSCLQELIRQVTLNCAERGQLLEKLWNTYIEFLEKGIIESNKEKRLVEKENLVNLSSLHKVYQKKLEVYAEQNKKLTISSNDFENKYIEAKIELKYFRKKAKTLDKENQHNKIFFKEMQMQMKKLNEMNSSLKAVLENADMASLENSIPTTPKLRLEIGEPQKLTMDFWQGNESDDSLQENIFKFAEEHEDIRDLRDEDGEDDVVLVNFGTDTNDLVLYNQELTQSMIEKLSKEVQTDFDLVIDKAIAQLPKYDDSSIAIGDKEIIKQEYMKELENESENNENETEDNEELEDDDEDEDEMSEQKKGKKHSITNEVGGIKNFKLKQVLSIKQEISKVETKDILNNIISDSENDDLMDNLNDLMILIDKSNSKEIEKQNVKDLLKYLPGKISHIIAENIKMKVDHNEKNVEILDLNDRLYHQIIEAENLQSEV